VKSLLDLASLLLYPTFCSGCQRIGKHLCFSCYEKLEYLCSDVELKIEPLYLDTVQAAVAYKPPVNTILHKLKYQSVRDLGQYCGQLIFQTVALPEIDIVTYIPLHPSKQRARGFNQAQVIAETLANLMKKKCLPMLSRVKNTTSQALLQSDVDRQHNMSSAFQPKSSLKILGQKVLLIDDVVTTGNTLNEASRVLKLAGAAVVSGVTVAHGQ